jgi:hypothetical protein
VRHLSSNRYAAEVMQQHVSPIEPPQSTHENAPRPAQSVEAAPPPPPEQDVPSAPVPPSPEEMASNPTEDHAAKILAADTRLDDETRANAWDIYHTSATPQELVRNLSSLSIPNSTKYALWTAKSATAPAQSNVEKAANALQEMAKVDPQALEIANKFPKITKIILDAVKDEPREG